MQAYVTDLSNKRDSPSFAICQRVLHKCHEIVFGDQLHASSSPYATFTLPSFIRRRKIKHHAEPVFVGIGVLLAGVPGMPRLAEISGEDAIEQGRADEEGEISRGYQSNNDDLYSPSPTRIVDTESDNSDIPPSPEDETPPPFPNNNKLQLPPKPLGRRRTLGAQTLPALPLHLQTAIRKPKLSESDPLGQLDNEDQPALPYKSSPSLPSAKTPLRTASLSRADIMLEKYDAQSQMYLLRGHYYLSEVRRVLVFLLRF